MYTAFDRDCRERFVPQISVLTPDGAVPDDYLGEETVRRDLFASLFAIGALYGARCYLTEVDAACRAHYSEGLLRVLIDAEEEALLALPWLSPEIEICKDPLHIKSRQIHFVVATTLWHKMISLREAGLTAEEAEAQAPEVVASVLTSLWGAVFVKTQPVSFTIGRDDAVSDYPALYDLAVTAAREALVRYREEVARLDGAIRAFSAARSRKAGRNASRA